VQMPTQVSFRHCTSAAFFVISGADTERLFAEDVIPNLAEKPGEGPYDANGRPAVWTGLKQISRILLDTFFVLCCWLNIRCNNH
jgi:hypothetical protein